MKRIVVLVVTCILMVMLSGYTAFSQEVVNAKELSDTDVKNAVKSLTFLWGRGGNWYGPKYPGHSPDSIEVIGVHQEDNKAKIYCKFKTQDGKARTGAAEVIRFTSGKWYCPSDDMFLTK